MSQLLDDLRAARAVYAERGGHKGSFYSNNRIWPREAIADPTCRVCMLGAVQIVTADAEGESADGRYAAAWNALNAAVPTDEIPSDYNDRPDVTAADVLAVFDHAIEREASK